MEAATWIGLALTLLVALGGFVGFGLSYFASRSEVARIWAEIDRIRDRLHKMPGEIMTLLDRKEHGDE